MSFRVQKYCEGVCCCLHVNCIDYNHLNPVHIALSKPKFVCIFRYIPTRVFEKLGET